MIPNSAEIYKKLSSVLKCEVSDFESRWTAD